jgi:inorganic pyrophosphatase
MILFLPRLFEFRKQDFMLQQYTRALVLRCMALGLSASFIFSCAPDRPDFENLPAFTGQGINVVVEIPAGTNLKIEYDKESELFLPDIAGAVERVVGFLPYPANYGFIPSTLMDPAQGGDGDALDVLLLSSSLPTGSVVEALPVAALQLRDGGVLDTKIIAVPRDSTLRVIKATDYRSLLMEYDGARRIIEEWFLNYKGLGATDLIGWKDEQFANQEINRWKTR